MAGPDISQCNTSEDRAGCRPDWVESIDEDVPNSSNGNDFGTPLVGGLFREEVCTVLFSRGLED